MPPPGPQPDGSAIQDQKVRKTPAVWLATGLGIGLVVPAAGTVGALVWGMPLAWGISLLPAWWWRLGVILLLCLVGVPLCTRAGRDLGGKKDPQAIVWDEIVTVPLVFLFVPLSGWLYGIAGFLLIRLFDIAKPPPIDRLESLPEGSGVMVDDCVAGLYAALSLAVLEQFLN